MYVAGVNPYMTRAHQERFLEVPTRNFEVKMSLKLLDSLTQIVHM